ncbi:MAG: hypothetical protein JJ971_02530 [Balneolaceae bacterium]|nr:hypothetical protein [Balneolaceae bacterium]MBO6545248.1 hypothetical protein [Balneolaceae bacterium]MBO6646644.1 hypothetical protein [Balneolaceae bacterium]
MGRFFSFTILLLIVALSQALYAQDKIIQLSSITLEGDVRIFYEDLEDLILLDDEPFEANQIQRIELQFGKTLHNRRLVFYNPRSGHVIEKYVLLTIVLGGQTKLYGYDGPNFDFVLEHNGNLFALLETENTSERDRVENYKFVLNSVLESCTTFDEIALIGYNRKDLSRLINSYNVCKMENPESSKATGSEGSERVSESTGNEAGGNANRSKSVRSQIRRNEITSVSLYTGVSHASHSLKTRILTDRDIVDQRNVTSNNLALGGFFQNNLFSSKKLFFELGVYYRRLNFGVRSVEKNLTVDNLAVHEISIGTGLNYKFLPTAKLSPEVTLGGYAWTMGGHDNLYPETSDRFPALHSKYSSRSGIGGSFRALLNYKLKNDIHFFIAGTYLLKNRDDAFTNRVPGDLKEKINDSLTNNYTVTFGLTFSNSR